MDSVVVFDLRGSMAHFRRPDTLSTHASYPIIPRTTLRGLVAAVLGLSPTESSDGLPPDSRLGLRLIRPVAMVAQQLTMHGKKWIGKGTDANFHRPTSIEVVVNPHYRVFYSGPMSTELSNRIQARQSEFHTYLGSAYCLTFPEWKGTAKATSASPTNSRIECESIVPTDAIKQLFFEDGLNYSRASGMLHEHIGGRRFRGTISVIYEASGGKVVLEPNSDSEPFWQFMQVENEGNVCLW